MKVVPVIMAGGAGTRLWPLSREEKPKQFHNLSGGGSLLEETIKRLLPLSPEKCVVVTSQKYADMSTDAANTAGLTGTVLAEPEPKNTSAAVLYAAVYLDKLFDDSIMIILPADHFIRDKTTFTEALSRGIQEAEKGHLVTIGIRPTYAETGYGYIKAKGGSSHQSSETKIGLPVEVECFVEKPDEETAKKYLAEGTYFWNAGIFLWKTSVILKAFQQYLPNMAAAFEELHKLSADEISSMSDAIWTKKVSIFKNIESISIDYGILEKASNQVMVPADFGWADLGSWKSIDDILPPDASGNRAPTAEKAIFVDAENCSVFAENARISIVGLSNIVAVQTDNDILIINKDNSQDVRKVVEIVKNRKK